LKLHDKGQILRLTLKFRLHVPFVADSFKVAKCMCVCVLMKCTVCADALCDALFQFNTILF